MKKLLLIFLILSGLIFGQFIDDDFYIPGRAEVISTVATDYLKMSNETTVISSIGTDSTAYYSFDDGSNVHIAALIDDNATESTEYLASTQDVINAGVGTSLRLDGVDDYVNLDLLAAELVSTSNTKGTIVWKGKIHDFIASPTKALWSFGDANANTIINAMITTTNYKLRFECVSATVEKWRFITNNTYSEDTEYVIIFVQNGIEPVLYINGILEPITFSVTTDKTVWYNSITGIDNGRIGCANYDNAGNVFFGKYSIDYFNAWNYAWTSAEVQDFYQSGAVPYKYQGASQTELITNGSFTGSAAGWNLGAGWAYGTNNVVATTASSDMTQTVTVLRNKVHLVKADITKSAGAITMLFGGVGDWVTLTEGTNINTILTAATASNIIYFRGTGFTGTVDNVSATQIGLIDAWLPEGITSDYWYAQYGNDGTHNATPVNAYVSAYYHNAEADATGIPEINYKDSPSPADNDEIKNRDGEANNSAGEKEIFTRTLDIVSDATDGTEDGRIEHWVMVNGTLTKIVTYDATGTTIVGNVAATTYESTVTAAELAYVGDVTSLIQAQLDARCLESVFGTAIGTGLLLDATTLKTHAALQSIAGLAETNGGIAYGTADNTYAWLAAGDAGKFLRANGAAAPTWESVVDVYYGEMYLNNNGVATTIETANIPIMIRNFTTGSVNGFTYDAGSTNAITAYADYSGTVAGTVLATTTSTTSLATGDEVSIRGTTNYNDVFTVTVVDATHFYFTDTWVADDGASDWDEGSYLLADAGSGGLYRIIYNLSCSEGGAAGSNVVTDVYINATPCGKCISKRKFANNDYGSVGGTSIETIAAGDKIYITLQSDGVNAITAQYGNISISRL